MTFSGFGALAGSGIRPRKLRGPLGTLLFTIPQIPLTLGNAVIAITAENNELFPDRPVTEKKIAISQGIMKLVSRFYGGIPMCHGAGGMAGMFALEQRPVGRLSVIIICAVQNSR
jgi:hypothetical protein